MGEISKNKRMKKLKWRREVIANLADRIVEMVKGGIYTLPLSVLPTQEGSYICE